jgi:hypothetical protein
VSDNNVPAQYAIGPNLVVLGNAIAPVTRATQLADRARRAAASGEGARRCCVHPAAEPRLSGAGGSR